MVTNTACSLPRQAFESIHPEWRPLINSALKSVSGHYLQDLSTSAQWLPGMSKLFNAFSLPLSKTRYILLGESPYPRQQSANGYAFWDGAVDTLWSDSGLSKAVNRATSLRNFIKMLLVAGNHLNSDTSQKAISRLSKQAWISTIEQLFTNLLSKGFLLLNASLVLSERPVNQDAKAWRPFLAELLTQLAEARPDITVLLFGRIAEKIAPICPPQLALLCAEHPYNISFIHNLSVVKFFAPLDLLKTTSK